MPDQGVQLRGKDKRAPLQRIEKGFLAEPIPRKEKTSLFNVIQRESPHPVQTGNKLLAPLTVTVEQDLGIRVVGQKTMPELDKLPAEFQMIVDLAVENDSQPTVRRPHGLVAADQIDDGKAAVPQINGPRGIVPMPLRIGPAMAQQIGHVPQIGVGSGTDKAADAAHQGFTSILRHESIRYTGFPWDS